MVVSLIKNGVGGKIEPGEINYEFSSRRIMLDRLIKNKMFIIGGIVVVLFILAALVGPYLTKYIPVTWILQPS